MFNAIFFSVTLDPRTREKERSSRLARERSKPAAAPSPAAAAAASTPGAIPAPNPDDLATDHDLQGVLAFNRAEVPGLFTLATATVHYGGCRVIAQSIVPGILQVGERLRVAASCVIYALEPPLQLDTNRRMLYGSVDEGVSIVSAAETHRLMQVRVCVHWLRLPVH